MKYRNLKKGGDLFSALEHQQSIGQRQVGILKLRDIVNWESFRSLLEEILGYDRKDWSKGGAPPFDPVFMFKVLVLQKYHGLSDEATQAQIEDRISFMSFLGLEMGDDIPDQNTIWDFRQSLEKDGRKGTQRLFEHFDSMLVSRGLIGREGSIVDASFVDAPKQRNTREESGQIKRGQRPEGFEKTGGKGRQKDCDARWTSKYGERHYGYKNHIKADARSKLIIKYATSEASLHDSRMFESLVDHHDRAVLADNAYQSEEAENYLLECNCEEFLAKKAYRNRPLTAEQEQYNSRIKKIRVRVEHIFGRMSQMGMDYVRSIGRERAHQHNGLCNLVYNMERYAFLCRQSC